MASLTKVAYGVKIRRGPTPSIISTDRTGLETQEIPPALCHLTGDALATPFPPIAPGGYLKYYRSYYGYGQDDDSQKGEQTAEQSWEVSDSLGDVKRRRRASSVSMLLGPLLSHTPKPSPSKEIPPKSHLFHTHTHTSSGETSPPVSPTKPPPLLPRSKRRRFLSIIPEASRETMRSEMDDSRPSTRKSRVVSYPPATPSPRSSTLGASALTLSLPVSPSPRSSSFAKPGRLTSWMPLSPGGSLRRKKRQLLRTPSVENDLSRCAKEIMGLTPPDADNACAISRENSSGSEVTEEESLLSPTMTVSTAVTSLLEPSSLPASPSSPTKPGENGQSRSGDDENTGHDAAARPNPTLPHAVPQPQAVSHTKSESSQSTTEFEDSSESESNGSPTISTPPTSFGGCRLAEDEKIREFLVLGELDDDEGNRDSWASYVTAKSSFEPLPAVEENDEGTVEAEEPKDLELTVSSQVVVSA
ncbi:hypothetical protein P691DRAFT_757858 [Macrolepiota fuliginosa MF-IS2]|uniref:Uncharacterized protein n=1 Tax=Macrolepiota fuliginosa MF-IS2 TaxID=1400762 RepID=A0A9P5XG57_9AGAR|nr:hypothetical protein P691DRAFT_757858 [Macrolepiota fuliginosa MF-IS2]